MTPKLEPPATEPASKSTVDEPPLEVFPYTGNADQVVPAPASRGPRSRSLERSVPTDCPVCDGATVNGAGLFACTDCDWYGPLR